MDKPIGTGPYKLAEYVKGDKVRMVRNENYFKPGLPYLDEIDFKVGVDDNAALQQVEAGTLDLLGDPIPAGSFEMGASANARFAYDNERPRHGVTLEGFEINRQLQAATCLDVFLARAG